MIKVKVVKNLLLLLLFTVYLVVFVLIQNTKVIFVDEGQHFEQTKSFISGNFSQNPNLMMFPGFHLVISLIARLFENASYPFLRTVSFSINLLMIFVYYLTARLIDRKNAFGKSLLIALLPVLFPYLFLFYTDGFSLLTIVLAYYLALNKKYFLSGLVGTYSLFVRQNNLFLILFIYFIIYIQNYGWKMDLARLMKYIRKLWIIIFGFLIFGVCVVLSEKTMSNNYVRSTLRFSASSFANIYFSLFVSFWLLLPLHLANLRKILPLFRRKLVILLIFTSFCLFLVSFIPDHPYNQATWFLHNSIFLYFSADLPRKILFFIIAITSALSFGVTKLIKKEYYWLYPFTVFYLLPHKLIELRYSIVPLALFLLFMEKKRGSRMAVTGLLFLSVSLYLLWGILTTAFFP